MNEKELHEKIAATSRTIFAYCMARTQSREDAEDLSQDIVCELLKSSGNLRDDRAFYAFMWGVAGNVCKQWYRKKKQNIHAALTDDLPAEDLSFEEESDEVYLLRRELALLSRHYRKATILYYVEGCSCSEIASMLSISESMVKYLLFKSRKILKEGMSMERNWGELSYHPKTLVPMYSGRGPNRFWQFMQSKIRQNIVSACYNDALTVQEISLATGVPLPYLDDEIQALTDRQILICEGKRYMSNVIVITSDCADEIERALAKYHEQIANQIEHFLIDRIGDYRSIGFRGCDFSENTLRWQLAVVLFRTIRGIDCGTGAEAPRTGWGESAYLWCVEKLSEHYMFAYCGLDSRRGDSLYFFDCLRGGKGDHHDFYGNERFVNIFSDICHGETASFSEYDWEAVAEMIRLGYVIRQKDGYTPAIVVYTAAQYDSVLRMAKQFCADALVPMIREMEQTAADILISHTPKHVQNQVAGIAAQDKFLNAVCIPASHLMERSCITTVWHPLEMPTTYLVLHN